MTAQSPRLDRPNTAFDVLRLPIRGKLLRHHYGLLMIAAGMWLFNLPMEMRGTLQFSQNTSVMVSP